MNSDIRRALLDAEQAWASGDLVTASRAFVDAGDTAVRYQLWKSALRAYRGALEVDVLDKVAIGKLVALGTRVRSAAEWTEYAHAVELHSSWPHFSSRNAHVTMDDRGAIIECSNVGAVLELAMTSNERIDVVPETRWMGMPVAMALIILRRAMWPNARDQGVSPMRLRVVALGRPACYLDELGDWVPA